MDHELRVRCCAMCYTAKEEYSGNVYVHIQVGRPAHGCSELLMRLIWDNRVGCWACHLLIRALVIAVVAVIVTKSCSHTHCSHIITHAHTHTRARTHTHTCTHTHTHTHKHTHTTDMVLHNHLTTKHGNMWTDRKLSPWKHNIQGIP